MPKTNPRKLRLGGMELSVTLDRVLAERIKRTRPFKWLYHPPPGPRIRRGEPVLDGVGFDDIEWYQTIDLPGGVTTPGFVDHREQVGLYGIPDSLEGKRCLDIATFDGFWAFEMERRGASEVVAIDVYGLRDCDVATNYRDEYVRGVADNVKGFGFAYAKRALGSHVQRKILSVYELSPETVGSFDFVFLSDMLIHVRDPMRAIEAVWSVVRRSGEAIIAEIFDPDLEEHERAMRFVLALDHFSGCSWWYPTSSALKEMLRLARFEEIEEVSRLKLRIPNGTELPKAVLRARGGGAK